MKASIHSIPKTIDWSSASAWNRLWVRFLSSRPPWTMFRNVRSMDVGFAERIFLLILANVLVRSPQNLLTCIVNISVYRIKVSPKCLIEVRKQKPLRRCAAQVQLCRHRVGFLLLGCIVQAVSSRNPIPLSRLCRPGCAVFQFDSFIQTVSTRLCQLRVWYLCPDCDVQAVSSRLCRPGCVGSKFNSFDHTMSFTLCRLQVQFLRPHYVVHAVSTQSSIPSSRLPSRL